MNNTEMGTDAAKWAREFCNPHHEILTIEDVLKEVNEAWNNDIIGTEHADFLGTVGDTFADHLGKHPCNYFVLIAMIAGINGKLIAVAKQAASDDGFHPDNIKVFLDAALEASRLAAIKVSSI